MNHSFRSTIARLLLCLGCFASFPAAAELQGISPDEARTLMDQGVPLIDIRTTDEWRTTGVIAGSHPLTFFDATGQYDIATWSKALKAFVASTDRPLILVCRSGNRSAVAGKMLSEELGYQKVYHLEKGIRGWTAEGNPLAKATCPGC